MSEEYDHHSLPETNFTPFWPNLILALGFLIWFGIQDYQLNSQRSFLQSQLSKVQPNLEEAKEIKSKSDALVSDLLKSAQTDPAAAQIIRDAVAAGILHVNQGAGAPAPDAAAAPAK